MGRRVNFYLDDDLIEALNQHTQVSPLSRSEIVAIALRRLLRDERPRGSFPPGGWTGPGSARCPLPGRIDAPRVWRRATPGMC